MLGSKDTEFAQCVIFYCIVPSFGASVKIFLYIKTRVDLTDIGVS